MVILTHKLWLKLGADRKIIGTPLRLDGEPYTVVGVQAQGDQDRGENQLTVPLVFKPEQLNHDFHWLLVMGRMKPGVTLAAGAAEYECGDGAYRAGLSEERQGLGRQNRAAAE